MSTAGERNESQGQGAQVEGEDGLEAGLLLAIREEAISWDPGVVEAIN